MVLRMKRDIVVYFGMGFLPDHNAVACREQAVSYIVKEAGYIPVLIGISNNVNFGSFEKTNYNDTDCYNVKYAKSLLEKFKDINIFAKTVIKIFEDIGVERIRCFIMQDYQLGPMKELKQFCKQKGIAFVADIMDWFTPTRDYSLSKNITKTIDTCLRMNLFYPFLKNKIYISHKFKNYFNDSDNKNTLVLPCTCRDFPEKISYEEKMERNITITFAGFLGTKCEKEKLDWIIRALYENKSNIDLNVIGISKEEFENGLPEYSSFITEHIKFWGYLSRKKCIETLQKSDFSIIARKRNKLTEYGFSSKICEAFACGVPVIATNNSDNSIYIQDGVNGYICDTNYESLKELLSRIEKIDCQKINKMRSNLKNGNILSVNKYINDFAVFIKNLIV